MSLLYHHHVTIANQLMNCQESVPISYIVETGSADTRRRVAKIGIDLFLKMVSHRVIIICDNKQLY